MILMMLLVSFEVFIRKTFGWSTMVAHDLSGFFLVAITFLGAAQTLRAGRHLRVTFLFDRLGPKTRFACNVVNMVIAIGLVSVLLWVTGALVMDSYEKGALTQGVVQFPEYVPQLLMPLGLGVFLLQLVVNLFGLLKNKVGR